jgi:hypothetical protein
MDQRIERYLNDDEIHQMTRLQALVFARVVKETMAGLEGAVHGDAAAKTALLSDLADAFTANVLDPRHLTHP